MEDIHFLGHIISKDGVCMDPTKLEAIKSWPHLTNLHEVRSFSGLCSYYRRFIRNFAKIALPLHALQKKLVLFQWGPKEIATFEELRDALLARFKKEKTANDIITKIKDLNQKGMLVEDYAQKIRVLTGRLHGRDALSD